jgi:nicotinamidase-related amidase
MIAGQAKSHCVASTIDDLLADVQIHDVTWRRKFISWRLRSPVVILAHRLHADADAAYRRFAELVRRSSARLTRSLPAGIRVRSAAA